MIFSGNYNFNLQDEIDGWGHESQLKLLDLATKRLSKEKLKEEINKLKAETKAKGTGKPMAAATFNALRQQAANDAGVRLDERTGAIVTRRGGPVSAIKALDITDTIIQELNAFGTGSKKWVDAMKKSANKSALSALADINEDISEPANTLPEDSNKVTKGIIKTIKESNPTKQVKLLEKMAKKIHPNSLQDQRQLINNLRMIVKHYELSSS